MDNKLSQALVLTLTAPADGVVSGIPQIIGNLLIIPKSTVAEGAKFAAEYKGECKLKKVSADSASQLEKAYFKVDSGEITSVASGNKLVGVFGEDVAADTSECSVILSGTPI